MRPQRPVVDVAGAIAAGRLVLYRQGIVTPHLVKRRFEVLTRLVDETGQLVPPNIWLPELERDADLAWEFDLWVLGQTLRRISPHDDQVWVNFCGSTVRAGFAEMVETLLRKYGVEPERLCVEVTEQVALGNGYKAELQKLIDLGCDLAIDDVGAGYSNWGSLVELPYTWMKVDGGLLASPRKLLVAKHLILLAKTLRLGVVAEWVETQRQAEWLLRWGCDGFQIDRFAPF
ncbi:MAG: EAL domain-containing protein, partial [Cyanobacteria bacterium P01_H01_bin.152]